MKLKNTEMGQLQSKLDHIKSLALEAGTIKVVLAISILQDELRFGGAEVEYDAPYDPYAEDWRRYYPEKRNTP